ncbi:optineurin-like [Ptychodera flava]|uniref:optineurin-like n=1 Tax=Ptychodera flava TaxID=63121 RepID=UPI003969D358
MGGQMEKLKEDETTTEDLQSQIEEIQKANKELLTKNSRFEKTIVTLHSDIGYLKKRLGSKCAVEKGGADPRVIHDKDAEIVNLKAKLASADKAIADKEDEIKKQGNNLTTVQAKLDSITMLKAQDEADPRADQMKDARIENLTAQLVSADESIAAQEDKIEELRNTLLTVETEKEDEIMEMRNSLMTVQAKLNTMTLLQAQGVADPMIIQGKDEMIDNLTSQLVSADEVIRDKDDEIKELRNELVTVQANLDSIPVLQAQRVADQMIIQDKEEMVDNLTAQLASADEAIRDRDDEIKVLRNELVTVQANLDTMPVLYAQADIFHADFQAEKKAKEKALRDKEVMDQEMMLLQLENQRLQDELNTYTNNQ